MTIKSRDTRTQLLLAAERSFAHKGYAAVGINEVLSGAGVPKGSFYHYFGSKDAFGEAVIVRYFEQYLTEMDEILDAAGQDWAARILAYFASWRASQSFGDCAGKCLAVKLSAEVADMSEPMRLALKAGTTQVVDRLERAITGAVQDGSSPFTGDARATAESLYQLWLGASVMAKVQRSLAPMDTATALTRRLLGV
ncbi:TetR family transcriptional regulator [Actinoplanes philippinensis]|uniref:TetR/AcrR family transcriptional regulator, transcriptional repressor for nem operon n=1 Tax=Actinoplanes philippinensis TaxID=35752 RepID=A0A1I2I2P7_9ACTN|nr:TetR/AcrR family transcriptional regulator [Actinoplanes philippinensis]GIE78680.1 TetR family transcriptional regulator [Actinoplanes philippinensis]SFF36689.1 TetR/AcrR family transcriptional regulator, transcriptional repressor for nem operon [Actinoplanes philippinensis]